MPKLDPPPDKAPVTTDPTQPFSLAKDAYIGPDWLRWFLVVLGIVNSVPQKIGTQSNGSPPISLTNQSASIGTTTIPLPALANGSYRVSAYARVTTPDGVSSSLAVIIGWTESSTSLSKTLFTLTGDTTTTVDAQIVSPSIDQNSAITYRTTYASNTPAKMKYKLLIWVEAV